MNLGNEKNIERTSDSEKIRQLGDAFISRYEKVLDIFCESENPTQGKLCEIFWQSGVVDRLMPENYEEVVARKATGRDVFEGERDSSEFFWRILYVCAQVELVDSTGSGERSTWLSRPMEFTIQKILNTNPDLYEKLFTEDGENQNPDLVFIHETKDRAVKMLRSLGEKANFETITAGASIKYGGITATVQGYTSDGLVVLHTADKQDHIRLTQANPLKSCAVLAREIEE